MNVYNFILLWLAVWAVVANQTDVTQMEYVTGKKSVRFKVWVAIIVFLPIFLLASLSEPISDTSAYLVSFDRLPDSFSYLSNDLKGKGFWTIGILVKKIFGNNRMIYRLVIAAIHSIPLILVYRKYSTNYLISIFLFVASTCNVAWMMNGLRQFVAVVIIFAATPLLLKKKYILSILTILIAATVHSTAILMIPVIFIVQGKAWNWKTVLYIFSTLAAMYLFTETGLLESLLDGTEYAGAVSTWQALGDNGTSPLRVLVNAVPVGLAFVGRKCIERDDDIVINVCTNMSIVTLGIYLISMVTSGVTFGRIPIYTSLYNFILLPYLVNRLFSKESVNIVKAAMIGFYLIYYYYQMHMVSGLI